MAARAGRRPGDPRARGRWLGSALVVVPLCWSIALADDLELKQRELDALRERIATVQKDVTAKQGRKSKAEQAVREVEREIGKTVANIRSIDRGLDGLRSDLDRLRADAGARRTALASQRARLAQEIRAAYAMGRQHQVKLLLNQERPSSVGRAVTYFGYFGKARVASIQQTRDALTALRELESEIEGKTAELDATRVREEEARAALEAQMHERQAVVDDLARELQNQGGALVRMQGDEEALRKLVGSLIEALADIPAPAAAQQAFGGRKGRLKWPASGRMTQRFGATLAGTGFAARGVFIATDEGDSIRAVSGGRVAFADWLRGFGLLLILDHGDGYMSLYGHNQAIYKDVGEWVGEGEVIAAAGRSGGYSTPGLYFELRSKGRPVDPVAWCAGKPGGG